jgi:hypothetical protein
MTGMSVLGVKGQSARRSVAASTVAAFSAGKLLRRGRQLWTDIARPELAGAAAIWQAAG